MTIGSSGNPLSLLLKAILKMEHNLFSTTFVIFENATSKRHVKTPRQNATSKRHAKTPR